MLYVDEESKHMRELRLVLYVWYHSHLRTKLDCLVSDWHQVDSDLLDLLLFIII